MTQRRWPALAGAGRALATLAGLVLLWAALVHLADVPPFLLPDPWRVARTLVLRAGTLLPHAAATLTEMLLGLLLGAVLGGLAGLALAASGVARRWLLPLLVVSQAVPVFALAPLLVLWLGYGLASKVAMTTLVVFFPVTAALYDGLRRTAPGWLELAAVMGARPHAVLFQLRLPAALPALASGLRVAAATAPIGAVIGEWVGAGRGLGYLMLQANARSQTDLMFAALVVLCAIALGLWLAVDRGLKHLVPWPQETTP